MDSVTNSSDEEYDDSPAGLVSGGTQPPPYFFLQASSQHMFDDPISKYLQPIPATIQSHLSAVTESSRQLVTPNLASLSNQNLTSDPGCLDAVITNSSPDRRLGFTGPYLDGGAGMFQNPGHPVTENVRRDPADSVPTAQFMKGNKAAGRKRKKRTRASRRAPTTIMTTNTANFRAMVQEFTGIPATSLVPPHLHHAGIGLLGSSKLGFGCKLGPQLTYNSLLGPFAPKTKSAAFNDHSLSPQLTLPSDLSLFNFQPFVQVQDLPGVTGSESQNGSGKYPTQASAGGESPNEPVDHSAPIVDFRGDRDVPNDVIPRT